MVDNNDDLIEVDIDEEPITNNNDKEDEPFNLASWIGKSSKHLILCISIVAVIVLMIYMVKETYSRLGKPDAGNQSGISILEMED